MLKENIKTLRKSKKISQEQLAMKLNVVRQTVSKWEQGLSVPDAEMLIAISEVLETPVSTLLGENILESKEDDLKIISEKLEIINLHLSQIRERKRKIINRILILLFIIIILIFIFLILFNSQYLAWDYSNIETAILGVNFHLFEWVFIRIAPITLIFLGVIIFLNRKK